MASHRKPSAGVPRLLAELADLTCGKTGCPAPIVAVALTHPGLEPSPLDQACENGHVTGIVRRPNGSYETVPLSVGALWLNLVDQFSSEPRGQLAPDVPGDRPLPGASLEDRQRDYLSRQLAIHGLPGSRPAAPLHALERP